MYKPPIYLPQNNYFCISFYIYISIYILDRSMNSDVNQPIGKKLTPHDTLNDYIPHLRNEAENAYRNVNVKGNTEINMSVELNKGGRKRENDTFMNT